MLKLVVVTGLLLSVSAAFCNSKGDRILHDITSLSPPSFDQSKGSDAAYREQYKKDYEKFLQQKNGLILELYKEDPGNQKTAALMKERWTRFSLTGDPGLRIKQAEDDIDKVLAENPPEPIREAGDYSRIILDTEVRPAVPAGGSDNSDHQSKILKEVNDFIAKYPSSDDSPELLFMVSFQTDGQQQTNIYREIVAKYPNYKNAAMVKGALNQADAIGKPFALKFNDAISGNPIDVANYKGKVVLVDFWATWCGPCVAEMPIVKQTYAKYHEKGLELLGVSLDQPEAKGGLTKLKDFVAKNQILWPMYYQGNFWDSEYSSSMGIMSIPTMFVVDKQGIFRGTIDPRAQDFDAQLNKYMAE